MDPKNNQLVVYSFKIECAYNGTQFSGYAIQPNNLRTIQGLIQDCLSQLFRQKVKLYASGRTDKGVHAICQICSFRVKLLWKPDPFAVKQFLIKNLPRDIVIWDVVKIKHQFHAQYSVVSKTYSYLLTNKFAIDQIHSHYFLSSPIDIKRLNTALNLFVGTHDFVSFSTSSVSNTIRTINFFNIIERNDFVEIEINANGFLRSMARMIIAACVAYMQYERELEDILYLLHHPKKGSSILKAPAYGLYLKRVYY